MPLLRGHDGAYEHDNPVQNLMQSWQLSNVCMAVAASCNCRCARDVVGIDTEVVGGGGAAAQDELCHCRLGSSVHIISLHKQMHLCNAPTKWCVKTISDQFVARDGHVANKITNAGYGFIAPAFTCRISD